MKKIITSLLVGAAVVAMVPVSGMIKANAGEKQTVAFEIEEKTLEFWSENNKFEAESGWFKVWLALSSKVKTPVRFKLN